MINRLICWAVHNRLVVILLAAGLLAYGIYAFRGGRRGLSQSQRPQVAARQHAGAALPPHSPRRRLGDLLTKLGPDGRLDDEHGSFLQRGASDIYREQGERMIVVKFDIHNRDLAGAVAEAKEATKDLVHAPCRLTWGGEFREMEQAESRMCIANGLAKDLSIGRGRVIATSRFTEANRTVAAHNLPS